MTRIKRKCRNGVALLAVLIVIVAITIISLSYISRSDGELAYGQNMKLHAQADRLAESGLEHARAMILNPQDITVGASGYWTGTTGQQLEAGDMYYDVAVARHTTGSTPFCTFDVASTGYKVSGGTRTAESTLAAEVRLDPCIALWAGGSYSGGVWTRIYGDAYCRGNFSSVRTVHGDVYAGGWINTPADGQKYAFSTTIPVVWPSVTYAGLAPTYHINGGSYSAAAIGASPSIGYTISPSAGNPAGVVYYAGDLDINGNANIQGTLVVSGNLRITGANNAITASKNYPAIVVGGNLTVWNNATLVVNGLIVAGGSVSTDATNVHMTVNGGLFAAQNITVSSPQAVTITADHTKTALLLWDTAGGHMTWRQAGTGFLRNVHRQP